MESATKVFSKKGFTKATMKNVMEEAKISRGSLYAHFNNIEELFLEALMYDDILNEHSLIKLENEELSPEKFTNWIVNLFNLLDTPGRNLTRAKSEFFLLYSKNQVPYLEDRKERLEEILFSYISEGTNNKVFRSDVDINSYIDIFITSIDGLMLSLSSRLENKNKITKKINILADMLVNYII
ncbi:TetR/AcrR family transcriptional regulator [Vagococcus carniphilus]|uniref:TetR/AcrR family transcriptional regulator n=1 Tax=Vagococcus carniphilus TaxID=218144 RepID=UPI003BAAF45D